jgi:hypothetical protein
MVTEALLYEWWPILILVTNFAVYTIGDAKAGMANTIANEIATAEDENAAPIRRAISSRSMIPDLPLPAILTSGPGQNTQYERTYAARYSALEQPSTVP